MYTYTEFFRREGIALEYTDCPEEMLPISGDPHRLRQVFCNLLDNAAKHGGAGKRIDVSIAHYCSLYVSIRDCPIRPCGNSNWWSSVCTNIANP